MLCYATGGDQAIRSENILKFESNMVDVKNVAFYTELCFFNLKKHLKNTKERGCSTGAATYLMERDFKLFFFCWITQFVSHRLNTTLEAAVHISKVEKTASRSELNCNLKFIVFNCYEKHPH